MSNEQINALGLALQQQKLITGACIYISLLSISAAMHITYHMSACLILNFAEKLKPEGPHNAAAHNYICTNSTNEITIHSCVLLLVR